MVEEFISYKAQAISYSRVGEFCTYKAISYTMMSGFTTRVEGFSTITPIPLAKITVTGLCVVVYPVLVVVFPAGLAVFPVKLSHFAHPVEDDIQHPEC